MARLRHRDPQLYRFIRRTEKAEQKKPKSQRWKIDPRTGAIGGLRPKDAPVPVSPQMRFWLELDSELAGALDASGCYHNPDAVNAMLTEYGIVDFEERRLARYLLRRIAGGRAHGMLAVDDPDAAAIDDDDDDEKK